MRFPRRHLLAGAGAIALCPRSGAADDIPARPGGSPPEIAKNSQYWASIAAQYEVDRTVTNLENTYWGVMARPVEAAYLERTRFCNPQ